MEEKFESQSEFGEKNLIKLPDIAIFQLETMFKAGSYAEMESAARILIEQFPVCGLVWKALGVALQSQGKPALSVFQKTIEFLPNDADAHSNFGIALANAGQLERAVECYRIALKNNPNFAAAYNNLGIVLTELGQLDKALLSCRSALELEPDSAEMHSNLGNVLKGLGQLDSAAASYHRALEINPNDAELHSNLATTLKDLGQLGDAVASCRRALEIRPDFQIAFDNLLFIQLYQTEKTVQEISVDILNYDAQFGLPYLDHQCAHGNSHNANKRLRIGYVSADFRTHPVATFVEPLLASHDKSMFEIFCYSNHARQDAVTERIQAHVDHWLLCVALSDDQLAERIRADGIDILIDLSGHTAGNRLSTFARKPAPVQLTYLGYPGTSGLSAMDYRITDGYADPPGSEGSYSEQLLRLPDSLCCFQPGKDMLELTPLPALKNKFITFGSFNNSNKLDQNAIALWAQILLAVPSSRLLMLTIPKGERRDWIEKQFVDAGVVRERIEFHGKLPALEFQDMIRRADIALDPLLVTGGTTTCESLWMGVPVIVLVGQRFIHRVGASFLHSAGLPQYAATTPTEYVQIAMDAAADISGLAQLRAGIREQLAASALMDQTRFTHNFEITLRTIWEQWCNTH
ncbi:MAG: tetratricopeptide repeat protein [Undibacterium sp.]|uniref:O-linked N-acetylglucosamine transferase family protein n=1 Tax=Undibacterium sp. TaxID=1914977 RepID=UPI00271E2B11|nr:tetratricopeptide repeat protein [Undibacterium sp.]MDO8653797.1 tetratricopeptide repeat protein [Undibacterium sp.]